MYSFDHEGPIQLIQITDTHLVESDGGHLLGMDTLNSLECVLNIIRSENIPFEFFLVTGDLSQDGSSVSYNRLHDALEPFNTRSFWIAGNHDDMTTMLPVAESGGHMERLIRTPHWQLVMLNSQVDGAVFGNLSDDELSFLEQSLKERPDLHTMICLHHHPIPMDSRWIDNIGVRNGDRLMKLVEQYDNVKCIIWGHVHQDSDRDHKGIRMISTPSTCVQFEPHTRDFSVDDVSPGFRWMQLNPDGTIDTQVTRVEGIEFEVDMSVKGY